MIVIVDYGLGNPGSIKNMLRKIGFDPVITSDHAIIQIAEKLILPGVGAFDQGMKNLEEKELIPLLNRKVQEEKTPVLGICLGMHLFTRKSEEGVRNGLGWIDAETIRFDASKTAKKLPVPHMGWEYVSLKKDSLLLNEMYEEPKFYFGHSYCVKCENPEDVILTSHYIHEFDSAFQKENILGVQFHPEKSHKYGMKLLSNFMIHF
ncbi:imidazole glycerol phosphate synthase subunit HisH [Fluviicola sp.]|uniref:imidazole glycerol phosphate synthase subunit HisH n=1 Tax=Fluviicola sp. TaxID=1917219 RepID=UPI002614AFCE|nr:imidazole glycerol phosphate synthase subunit HisH [Fluviicola sp.]